MSAQRSTQVLLPLQTDPLLSSLYRTPKPQRTTSPSGQDLPVSSSSTSTSTQHIDVRRVALRSFRDRVILPPFQRLYARLSKHNRHDGFQDAHNYQQPRLKQMYVSFELRKQMIILDLFQATCPIGSKQLSSRQILIDYPIPSANCRGGRYARLAEAG